MRMPTKRDNVCESEREREIKDTRNTTESARGIQERCVVGTLSFCMQACTEINDSLLQHYSYPKPRGT